MILQIDNTIIVNLIWLRDNCRCMECYDWKTHQRKNNKVPTNYKIERYDKDEDDIQIVWNDGHKSQYSIEWVKEQLSCNSDFEKEFWMADDIHDKLLSIESSNGKLTDIDERILVKQLLQLGIAFVQNVNPTKESTKRIIDHLGPIMHTIYGGMWDIDTELLNKFKDSAYSEEYLSCHTDNTYFIEPPGLQVFHCTKPAEKGGESLFLDGFKAAQLFRERHPEFYECLITTPVEGQYISNDYHFIHEYKIFRTAGFSDKLKQIRFNMYDRSPRIPRINSFDLFYKSLNSFQTLLEDTKLQLNIQLQPGTVAFVNNWRVLHGRNKFYGVRKVHGCYVAMGTLMSKARKLRIIK